MSLQGSKRASGPAFQGIRIHPSFPILDYFTHPVFPRSTNHPVTLCVCVQGLWWIAGTCVVRLVRDLRGLYDVSGGKCAWKAQITCCFSFIGLFLFIILITLLKIDKEGGLGLPMILQGSGRASGPAFLGARFHTTFSYTCLLYTSPSPRD